MIMPKPKFTKEECKNNNHWFVPYNEGNMICMKCGRFAKVGRLNYKNADSGADISRGANNG